MGQLGEVGLTAVVVLAIGRNLDLDAGRSGRGIGGIDQAERPGLDQPRPQGQGAVTLRRGPEKGQSRMMTDSAKTRPTTPAIT